MKPHSCGHLRYRMTCEEYDELERQQGGACALCHCRERLMVDHDHALGMKAVRGLLCHSCNQVLRWHDSGRALDGDDVGRYLASAWHLTHRPGLPLLSRTPGRDDPNAIPVGPREVAVMLGVSRQRFGQLLQQVEFPEPWATLAKVTLWRDTDIAAWAKARGRKVEPHGVEQSPPWKP